MRVTAPVTGGNGAPFVLRELDPADPRPDELAVEVAAAGICHTDVICRDQWRPVRLWDQRGLPRRADSGLLRLDQIEEAAHDPEEGRMIKPVLRMG